MDEFINKILLHRKKYILNFILIGITIQFIIQLTFWIGEIFPLIKWDYNAADILNYWGSYFGLFISALVTILGVTYSVNKSGQATRDIITNSDNIAKENLRNSILPLIVINRKLSFYEGNWLSAMAYEALQDKTSVLEENKSDNLIPVEPMTHIEKEIDSFCFSIKRSELIFDYKLSKTQREELKNVKVTTASTYKYMPFTMYNAGLGVAVNMTITIVKDKLIGDQKFHITSHAISVAKNAMINLIFFLYDGVDSVGEYDVTIEYFDLKKQKYHQKHKMIVNQKGITFDLEINQELIV